ncbi:uncharacterized protein BCR38DRAFT_503287 [Pseudomassariella vexata]|uniref:TMEM205-like domain-containing protein n=1 Tax=Pseudomassariella vexata TaxID=1141098 RepID=A0A1Y2EF32_9PEZI|nr:uncharacterized protein BCR38DRAFT_503287 [Pseudomassariella vexata]ORY70159.1 hypothetical protein BCR38DRAFT_503287 [Pseudomassariella vexata]
MGESLIFSPVPYHILSYGTLLGTQFFHTFINAIASFKVLERPQFGLLQRAIFPAYFGMQTVIPVALAVTYPATRITRSGISGVLDETNRWSVLAPLATVFVTGLINWAYLLPATNAVTAKRRQQEKKDGKQSWDAPPHSQEMVALNKNFGQLHGLSSLLNVVSFIATVTYSFTLASRFH